MKDSQPRLIPETEDEILQKICKKHKLPGYYSQYLKRYLKGELSENRLVCCHSGCEICEDNIFHAVKEAKSTVPLGWSSSLES